MRQPDLENLQVDYGYALQAIREGQIGRGLEMAERAEIRRRGYPQVSVVVDLLGDVYLYREAGFIERPGASRYIIGRVGHGRPLQAVVADFVRSGIGIEPGPDDTQYFDSFDHVVTRLLHQAEADAAYGVPLEQGPVRARVPVAAVPAVEPVTLVRPAPGRAVPFDPAVGISLPLPAAPELRP
jgi:dTDP-4-amino-4,6-dideoxy-D-glucose ammonia-lyase